MRERGPIGAAALTDHGAVEPLDWSGWRGTGRMTTMALEILWTAGRSREGGKLYDVPERALPDHHDAPAEPFERWALLDRVRAAGLLARAGGPTSRSPACTLPAPETTSACASSARSIRCSGIETS